MKYLMPKQAKSKDQNGSFDQRDQTEPKAQNPRNPEQSTDIMDDNCCFASQRKDSLS